MPQEPRSPLEEAYNLLIMQTMPAMIQECGFAFFYPQFEARLWILFEIAVYHLTCLAGIDTAAPEVARFADHIREMVNTGVATVLQNHGYSCSNALDRRFLTAWLEVLVILAQQQIPLRDLRNIIQQLTVFAHTDQATLLTEKGAVELRRFTGAIVLYGTRHTFTPFPQCKPKS